MFISTYSSYKNDEDLFRYLFPFYQDLRQQDFPDHKMNGPYQLAFSTFRKNAENPSIIMENLSPAGAIYSLLDGASLSEIMQKVVLHRHDFYELMFVLSGEVFVNIENQRHLYTKGCCCLLNRNVMHAEEYGTESRFVFLQLSGDFFADLYHDLSLDFFGEETCGKETCGKEDWGKEDRGKEDRGKDILWKVFSDREAGGKAAGGVEACREAAGGNQNKDAAARSELLDFMSFNLKNPSSADKAYLDFVPVDCRRKEVTCIHDLFDRITLESLSPGRHASLTIKHLILELLCQLSDASVFSTTPVQIGSDAEYTIYSDIVSIMERNCGRVSRSQLSEQLNYSGAYLNEITKKYSGLSIFDFGMTFCMKEAVRLLLQSSDNVSDIGMALGFSNRSHFYKVFKEMYHMTPAEYRRKEGKRSAGKYQ